MSNNRPHHSPPPPIGDMIELLVDQEREATRQRLRSALNNLVDPLVEELFYKLKAKMEGNNRNTAKVSSHSSQHSSHSSQQQQQQQHAKVSSHSEPVKNPVYQEPQVTNLALNAPRIDPLVQSILSSNIGLSPGVNYFQQQFIPQNHGASATASKSFIP